MFRLHKWFLDCVTPAGDALVVYAATLRWGLLRVGYSATLARQAGENVTRTRFGRPPQPVADGTGCDLAAPRLGLRGRWTGAVHGERRQLWRSPRGAVTWHCLLPQATVRLELDGRPWQGSGYVEHLALDVAPWHLPIEELRWGRWHGDGHSLVWIQWQGPHPLRLCLRNGREVAAGPIDDGGFDLADGGRLQLAPPVVLRDGPLGRTVLAQRLLRWLPLPRGVRAMQETKWLARGTFADGGGERREGMALHEVVRWA